MAIRVTTTGKASKKKKLLVYGRSGVEKTRLCRTAKDILIISSEKKFESLQDAEIPVWTVETFKDFKAAIKEAVKGKGGKKFDIIAIDSISDITETAIAHEKKNHANPMKAYANIQDQMIELLKYIRDQDEKHFYIIAKVKLYSTDDNEDIFGPKMPGKQLGPELPYLFDYVFAMRRMDGDEDEGGYSYLQTNLSHDPSWDCKDSSGRLNAVEEPDLTKIIKKLTSK